MVSYVFGYLFLSKRYTLAQLCAVVLLTLGAVSATAAEILVGDTAAAAAGKGCPGCGDAGAAAAAAGASAALASPTPAPGSGGSASWLAAALDSSAEGGFAYVLRWWCGIAILATVLLLQTLLGSLQDVASKNYGRAPYEAMFYFHAFSLPAFALALPDFAARIRVWSATPALAEVLGAEAAALAAGPGAGALTARLLSGAARLVQATPLLQSLPVMWAHVLLNLVTQYACLVGVYNLIAAADQLTVNVALTVRKFLSLMLSIWVFGNTFTRYHWVGALLVIGGSTLYGYMPSAAPAAAGAPQAQAPGQAVLQGGGAGAGAGSGASGAGQLTASAMAERLESSSRSGSASGGESGLGPLPVVVGSGGSAAAGGASDGSGGAGSGGAGAMPPGAGATVRARGRNGAR
jgi:hypothetical protein